MAALARGDRVQFRAIAYDRNNVILPDVQFFWSVTHSPSGSIDTRGEFNAMGEPGEYPGAVMVEAVQAPRRASE